jgi:hypothetical protein
MLKIFILFYMKHNFIFMNIEKYKKKLDKSWINNNVALVIGFFFETFY